MKERDDRCGIADPTATLASCGVGAVADLDGRASHEIVELAFEALQNLDHRGARGAETKTGDGAGILLQKPHAFFAARVDGLPAAERYAVGQVFLPREADRRVEAERLIAAQAAADGLELLAWRQVPTGDADLGRTARASEPAVRQFFVAAPGGMEPSQFDARLYLLRRSIERAALVAGLDRRVFYVCSLDRRRIVYKGLLTSTQLRRYYPDLSQADLVSALALVHSRFSTNTLGAWHLAHPYRCLVHNGEINTLRGNRNWMRAREAELSCERFGAEIGRLVPIIADGDSDSAAIDQVLELLVAAGRPLPHALRMMIPEAWQHDAAMSPERRAFYAFHAMLMEPWDGPALVVATDGERIAAVLDRNGLRPCRIQITRDRLLVMGSETGLIDLPPNRIVQRTRLRPGQLFVADLVSRRIEHQTELFARLTAPPYARWLEQESIRLDDLPEAPAAAPARIELAVAQRAFGYTLESLQRFLEPMARDGKDPIGAMGDDAPPAALSARHRPIFQYFRQIFAQVSNPPLDYLREALVTSLASPLGWQRNLLAATPAHCRQVVLDSPILTGDQLARLLALDLRGMRSVRLSLCVALGEPFERGLAALRQEAERAIRAGAQILLLSDRDLSPEHIALPSLLAVGALHHHLIRCKLRVRCGIVLDSGHPCRVHDFCTLLGYGADAIHPWLAFDSVAALSTGATGTPDRESALANYRAALEDGILKVMSKMGISTLQGYRGAQVFEALGLDDAFIDEYFPGTPCPIAGLGLAHFEAQARALHERALGPPSPHTVLDIGGELYWRRDGEAHQWTPQSIGLLQQAARHRDEAAYRAFAAAVNCADRRAQTVRGLLDFVSDDVEPIPLDAVEPVEAILRRFSTGSMSFGALSREAHEALAVAMNRVGGKSGSGEGGEQVERFGSERECSMKQVASGRFGVTSHYLASARQIEIKMAQGAKPGEGGELPGGKVNEDIASVRFTTPGVGLISPPPHHDIYSIEDLAQLIYDLKCANPEAEVHVKLVAVANVGTIAAGVAKARADAILISGDSGGTGAARKTSIKSAGTLWEVGLAETQQVLIANRLRSRIRLRVDGGLKTGRDVAVAALLGAEEYGFGTAPLVALGCVMLRKCHCNTCSVGVATQDPALRARFAGDPEHVINYLRLVAQELRQIMARLGFATVDEMIGRVDRLRAAETAAAGARPIDLSRLLYVPPPDDAPRRTQAQQHGLARHPDRRLIRAAADALERRRPVRLELAVRNRDRALGSMLSWQISRRHGAAGLPADSIVVACAGSAGQSFGAFLAPGIRLALVGDANDYAGKGLSGGTISVSPPPAAGFEAEHSVIVGNVALYGATAGQAYFRGLAGERFAVRNSGAMAVVEGVGDHGCEYMTGGVVVVLGETGRNFGAGMSGGEAYVLDPDRRMAARINPDMVVLEPLAEARDRQLVLRLLQNHLTATGSRCAQRLIAHWNADSRLFVKVVPQAYAAVVEKARQAGRDIRQSAPAALATAG